MNASARRDRHGFGDAEALRQEPQQLRRVDAVVAFGLAGAAAALYGTTSHADWIFDPLRYADHTQRGELSSLLLLIHALGNLLPLVAFRGLGSVGYDGGALPVLEAVAVAGAAVAVALVFIVARRLGASRPAAAAGAALFAVSLGVWRGAGSAGVYGITLAALGLAWLAVVHHAAKPNAGRATLLGAATGLAISTHLATVTFAPAALAVAALSGARDGWRGRARMTAIAAAAAIAVAALLLTLTAGIATSWSPDGMRQWFLGPHVPEADPSRTVGFGFGGFPRVIASETGDPSFPGPLADHPGAVALVATVVVVGLALIGAVACRPRALGLALALGALLAIFAAGWYQAERPDYFSLALVPLALLCALGVDGIAAAVPRSGPAWVAAPVALLLVAPLGTWNLEGEVGQTLDRSRQRETAAAAIVAQVPPGARIVLSPQIAPRVAYQGLRASTGWAVLLEQVEAGAPRPGLRPFLMAENRSVFVSSRAFELTPAQAEFLETTEEELWSELRSCCRPSTVGEFVTDAGPESLYRLVASRAP